VNTGRKLLVEALSYTQDKKHNCLGEILRLTTFHYLYVLAVRGLEVSLSYKKSRACVKVLTSRIVQLPWCPWKLEPWTFGPYH